MFGTIRKRKCTKKIVTRKILEFIHPRLREKERKLNLKKFRNLPWIEDERNRVRSRTSRNFGIGPKKLEKKESGRKILGINPYFEIWKNMRKNE